MKYLQNFSTSPEFYLGLGLIIVICLWFIQRKRIKNRLKHYGRHQLINVDGKPVQQLQEPSMMTMPLIVFNYAKLKWVRIKILNETIHYNIENEYKFISQVFGGKVIAHKSSGNWVKFYFENFKDKILLPQKRRRNFEFGLGIDGLGSEATINIHNKSGVRLCGRPGSGKSFILKTIFQQVPTNYQKIILTSKPQEFSDYDQASIYDATDLDKLTDFSNEVEAICLDVKQKIKGDPIFIFLDEAQQDLRDTPDKARNQVIQVIVNNLNYLLGVGRAYEIFLIVATQTDTIREIKLDVRQLPILISGKLHSDYTCEYYGIPKDIGFRDDLHTGKLILADGGNYKVFKAYTPTTRGKQ